MICIIPAKERGMSKEKFIVKGKIIKKCINECPYCGIDGGPGPAMCCEHPQLRKERKSGYIISWLDSKNGFPEECPLLKNPNSKIKKMFIFGEAVLYNMKKIMEGWK